MQGLLSVVFRPGYAMALLVLACGGRVSEGSHDVGATAGTINAPSGGLPSVEAGGAGTGAIATSGGASGAATGSTGPTDSCPLATLTLMTSPADVCTYVELPLEFTRSNVLVVLDRSGSMAATPAGYTQSKWATVADVLKTTLNMAALTARFGALLYPYIDQARPATCELAEGASAVNVAVGPAADTGPAINALLSRVFPLGGTPTAASLRSAFDYYTLGEGSSLVGRKYVLLITDGGPNCNAQLVCGPERCTANLDGSGPCGVGVANCCDAALEVPSGLSPALLCLDDIEVIAEIDALQRAGIKTFVVGLPGSEPYAAYLDAFAVVGGAPVATLPEGLLHKYFAVQGPSTLKERLAVIATSLIRECVVPLAAAPADVGRLNLLIDCSPVPPVTGSVPNWRYDASTRSIVILDAQCDRIESTGVSQIQVVAGCPPFEPI